MVKSINKELKKKFMNDEFVFPKNERVQMFCDDGEGVLNMITSSDGDIHFQLSGIDRRSTVRHRMSGSLIIMSEQLEISRTIKYLLAQLENAYPKGTAEHQTKLIAERKKGNW